MIDAILFDKDGTLIDFQKTWGTFMPAFIEELAEGDADLATNMARALSFDLQTRLFAPDSPVIAGTPDEATTLLQPFVPHWTHAELQKRGDDQSKLAALFPVAPLRPLFTQLRASGVKLGVATNDNEDAARYQMEQLGIGDLFAQIIGFDSGFGGKPAPGMVTGFCQAQGVDPARCVMVGDSLHDLHAGRAAGTQTVAVLTGVATRTDLAPYADVVLPDISGLPAWLETKTDL